MKHPTKRRPRIAVVDDEKDYRTLICRWLAEGYEATGYKNAEDLLQGGPDGFDADLVITDVRMEGLDGFRLCKVLRSHPRHARVPVLFLTGVDPEEGLFAGQDAEGSAYLRKPIERIELLEQIDKLLDERAL